MRPLFQLLLLLSLNVAFYPKATASIPAHTFPPATINGAQAWKVYGPDLSGSYGGLQGLGGLEAVIGSDGVTRGIVSDWNGNTVGHVAVPGVALTWSSAQFLAYGPAPGWSTAPLDGTKPLHELLGYRGLTLDPPGYVQQGLRPYDPQTGRWLSPDPLGHSGSLSLYDYCDNDPLNVYDPDGRVGKGIGGGVLEIGKIAGTTVWNVGGSLGYGVTGIYDAFAGTNNAEEIYGKQAQGLRDTAKGVGNLVWNTGGTIGYGVASGVDKFTGGNYAQETYGQQWAGMKQIGAAFTAEGQSGGYRVGYTATQLAAIILPVKGGSVLRAGEVGEVANVARVASGVERAGAPMFRTWNDFQAGTTGQFASRAEAGSAWAAYKDANGIVTGTVRSGAAKANFLKGMAEGGNAPSWMNQWLQQGKVPPGYHVDHIKPLSIGGADAPSNMRLLDIEMHKTHHRFYRPWE